MNFEKGYLFHIYNQGNNRRKIFLDRENYLFFLRKIRIYMLPYVDLMAWCLMPNHFHFLVLVNEIEKEIILNKSQRNSGYTNPGKIKTRSLNDSIGIMLRSYTRAFNKIHGFSGTLFREATKADCVNCPKGITPAFFIINGIVHSNVPIPEQQYPQVCFNYIHNNPVKAKLVKRNTDWEFSSARDFAGLREGSLVNISMASGYFKVS